MLFLTKAFLNLVLEINYDILDSWLCPNIDLDLLAKNDHYLIRLEFEKNVILLISAY